MLIQPASSSSTSTGATAWTEITVDLSTAKNAEALDLGSLTSFSSLVIKSMTGAAKLHLNGGDGVTVEEGEARDGLEGETLAVTTEGSTGGTMTLELQGRP